jgi:hypothetical protein
MTSLMKANDLCLVTGVSGYLASWIAKDLLEKGFRVRGTIRSLRDESKLQTMRRLLPGVELVAADLRSPCQWIFHVASPQAVPSEKDRRPTTRVAPSGLLWMLKFFVQDIGESTTNSDTGMCTRRNGRMCTNTSTPIFAVR